MQTDPDIMPRILTKTESRIAIALAKAAGRFPTALDTFVDEFGPDGDDSGFRSKLYAVLLEVGLHPYSRRRLEEQRLREVREYLDSHSETDR